MALEDSIAALITKATDNLALPQTIANLAATLVTNIGVEYQNRISGLTTTFYVSATGDNSANGLALATPLFSIGEALRRTPRGGLCTVYLCSNFGLVEVTPVDGKHLVLRSPNATRYQIGFDRTQETIANVNVRSLKSFELQNGGTVRVIGLGVLMPAGDGVFATLPQDSRSAAFRVSDVSETQDYKVGLYYCDINFPDSNFGPLLGSTGLPTVLTVNNCTIAGTAMEGKYLYNVTTAAGTAANTLNYLRTNLTNV